MSDSLHVEPFHSGYYVLSKILGILVQATLRLKSILDDCLKFVTQYAINILLPTVFRRMKRDNVSQGVPTQKATYRGLDIAHPPPPPTTTIIHSDPLPLPHRELHAVMTFRLQKCVVGNRQLEDGNPTVDLPLEVMQQY